MPQAIELHDSEILAVKVEGRRVVIEMKVYLHISDGNPAVDRGAGWTQLAAPILDGAIISATGAAPFGVVDGSIAAEGKNFDNLVPLPFDGVTAVRLEFIGDEGQRLSATADGASIQLKGAPTYVEEFEA